MRAATRIYKLYNDSGKYTNLPYYKAESIIRDAAWHDHTRYEEGEQPLESLISFFKSNKTFEKALPKVSSKPLDKKAGKKNATKKPKCK